jgi:arylsulfatase A-like enzyme
MLAGVTDVRYPIALYEGEVTYADHEIGRMIDALERSRRGRRTLLVVVGDHGESLTEHGYYFGHSHFLYEASLRVPLFFRWPGRIAGGRIVEAPVSLVDLSATVLELIGIAGGPDGDGRSLSALLEGAEAGAPAAMYLERPAREGGVLRGIREGEWKYLSAEDGSEELYRLDVDPGEAINLAASEREEADRFRERLLELPSEPRSSEGVPADEETREKLRALGYVP